MIFRRPPQAAHSLLVPETRPEQGRQADSTRRTVRIAARNGRLGNRLRRPMRSRPLARAAGHHGSRGDGAGTEGPEPQALPVVLGRELEKMARPL